MNENKNTTIINARQMALVVKTGKSALKRNLKKLKDVKIDV